MRSARISAAGSELLAGVAIGEALMYEGNGIVLDGVADCAELGVV